MAATERLTAAEFFAVEYPRLVGALDLYLNDLQVAEEVAQEAMIRAFCRWERLQQLQSPGGWTYRVAINLANSHLRRRGAELRAKARAGPTHQLSQSMDLDGHVVRLAVSQLPAKQRSAVVLRYFLDMTAAGAGEVLGCSPEAVRSLTARAMSKLRRALGSDFMEGASDER